MHDLYVSPAKLRQIQTEIEELKHKVCFPEISKLGGYIEGIERRIAEHSWPAWPVDTFR